MGEKRLEENVVIATEKIKEVDKKKSPQQPTNIPVQGKPLEENNNISSIKVEAGNHNNVVFRPNRQKVTSDKADTKVQNGTRKLTALPKEDETKIPNGATRVKEKTVKLEDNAIVEEIRDSVKDVRDILDRLSKNEVVESKNEEVEQVKENIEEESALTTDNQAEKSVECPVVPKTSQKKEQNMEISAEVPFLLNETGVDNIADLDFDKVKEHLLAEEEATKNLRRKMETLRTQKSSSPPPHPYQQDRQGKDLSQKPNRQKDLDPGRSRGVVGRELSETPTSAILPGGKVARLPGGKLEKVEDQPSASRGKRPTWQNAAT